MTSGWLLTAFTAGGAGQAHAQPTRRRFPAGCVSSTPKPRSRTWQGLGVCDWPFLRRGGGRKSPRLPSPRRVTVKDTRTWQGHRGPRGHRGPGSSRCPDTCARADSGPFQPETPAPPIVQVPAPGGRRVALLSRARGPEHTPLLAAALTHAVRREAGGPRSPRPSSHPGGGGGRAPRAGAAAGPGRGGRLSRGRWGRRPSRGAASPGQELPLGRHLLVVAGPSVPSSPLHPGCCRQLSRRPPPGAELGHPRGGRPCPPGVEAGAGAALAAMGGGPSGPAARSPSGETARPRHREGWAPTAVFQQRRGLQGQTGHAGGGAGHPGAPRDGGGPTLRPASAGARGTRREQVRELTRDPRARLHAGPRPGPPAR